MDAPQGKPEGDALASIRHSLRTPLNQIIGYCELMLEELGNADDSDLTSDLRKIHTAGGQLLALINDSLAPWKLEAGTVDLDALRLEMRTPLNLIIGYSELCQEVAEENNQPRIVADLQKITGAAKNLLALFDSVSFPAQAKLTATRSSGEAVRFTLGKVAEARLPGSLLIVDDNEMNRDMLCRRLERQGHTVSEVENGLQALEMLRTRKFDLVLLDVVMPEMGGYETLQHIMADNTLRHIPVIMLSALDELDNVIRCVELGAADYVTKPFNPVLLTARIQASLEKKQLWDQERNYLDQIEIERQKAETLLRNILPESIAARLKQGENPIADQFPSASVLVADLADFGQETAQLAPPEAVELLNDIICQFDWLAELHSLEKIKTVADTYIAVAGAPTPQANHSSAVAAMALEMQKVIKRIAGLHRLNLQLRIGICSGPVIGGVIGRKRFVYDIWGEAMELAAGLENLCAPGAILTDQATAEMLHDAYQLKEAGALETKRRGKVKTFQLLGRSGRGIAPVLR